MPKATSSASFLQSAELGPLETGRAIDHNGEPAPALFPPHVPSWVRQVIENTQGPRCRLFYGSIRPALALPGEVLRQSVATLYRDLMSQAAAAGLPHLVRVWNAMPGITDTIDSESAAGARTALTRTEGIPEETPATHPTERYMAFNAGRHDAFRERLADFDRDLPAATGVGSLRDDAVHVALLASDMPGVPVPNPKQIPAFRYSQRYGKLPPCFARGTLWAGQLFISGTAAITGEDTRFEHDLASQTQLTLDNLIEVVKQANVLGFPGQGVSSLSELRVYLPPQHIKPQDRQMLYQRLRNVTPSAWIEFVSAPLCRRNLLVEIEALAQGPKPAAV